MLLLQTSRESPHVHMLTNTPCTCRAIEASVRQDSSCDWPRHTAWSHVAMLYESSRVIGSTTNSWLALRMVEVALPREREGKGGGGGGGGWRGGGRKAAHHLSASHNRSLRMHALNMLAMSPYPLHSLHGTLHEVMVCSNQTLKVTGCYKASMMAMTAIVLSAPASSNVSCWQGI